MTKHFVVTLILTVILPLCLQFTPKVEHGPSFGTSQKPCAEFSKNARFNPDSMINEKWFVFYYWADGCQGGLFTFDILSRNETRYLRLILDGNVVKPINWTSKLLLMRQLDSNITTLLVERNDRGLYWQYLLMRDTPIDLKLRPLDVRFKQKGGYVGVMFCRKKTVYVMSKLNEIPPKTKIQDAAATIGYRGHGGRSYLYQGHQWLPIEEADDRHVMNSIKKYERRELGIEEILYPQPRLGPIYNY